MGLVLGLKEVPLQPRGLQSDSLQFPCDKLPHQRVFLSCVTIYSTVKLNFPVLDIRDIDKKLVPVSPYPVDLLLQQVLPTDKI